MEQDPQKIASQFRGPSGDVRAEITTRVVRIFKEYYGTGPTKARTHVAENLIVVLLEGGWDRSEQALVAAGETGVVHQRRAALQGVSQPHLVDAIEECTGRSVLSFMSANDEERELAVEIFVLEPDSELSLGSEREAVKRWGEQTRQQSKALRERQAELRREQAQLRDERR